MYMAYTTNPRLPRVRMDAVRLVRSGWSAVKVAEHPGDSQSAVAKWVQRAPANRRLHTIPDCIFRKDEQTRSALLCLAMLFVASCVIQFLATSFTFPKLKISS